MKTVILFASPRKEGNTAAVLGAVQDTLAAGGAEIRRFDLYRMNLRPCLACRACQKDHARAYCVQKDDMGEIFEAVMESNLILLASPIYSWYCTPPLKCALDRLVYAMNKYYRTPEEDAAILAGAPVPAKGPAIWAGKSVAIVTTCGYRPEKGADLFEEGIRRYCKHSQLRYLGMLAERHLGYGTTFMDEEKEERAREFAGQLLSGIEPR